LSLHYQPGSDDAVMLNGGVVLSALRVPQSGLSALKK
jgi:hypothetical protein